MKEYKYKDRYVLKIMRAKDLPLWQLDLSEMYELYPNFKNWLKYSICDKKAIACFYNCELVGYLIYSKKRNFKYVKLIDENLDVLDIYKMNSVFIDNFHRGCGIASQMLHLLKEIENPDYIYTTTHNMNVAQFLVKNHFYLIPGPKHKFTKDFIYLYKQNWKSFEEI